MWVWPPTPAEGGMIDTPPTSPKGRGKRFFCGGLPSPSPQRKGHRILVGVLPLLKGDKGPQNQIGSGGAWGQ